MIKRLVTISLAACMLAYPFTQTQAATTSRTLAEVSVTYATPQENLSADQMDNLLAPIALYPDPLLAQVLPASTFVDQIDQAARWLRANPNNAAGVDKQSWDVAVKSTAHYPQVIYMMSDKLDWTTALGQAYVNQSTDVLTSIQRLRAPAKSAGNLATTPQQTVIVEKEVIKIVPAQPQVIYVPTYNPQVVYVQPSGPSTGAVVATAAISFGVGLAIGAWLNNDCDWYGHRVYYHGWSGGGWVGYSRTYVHVNNNYYVNNRYTNVNVNRTVVNRNVNYNNINHYNSVSRNVNYNNINRTNVNTSNINRTNVNTNNLNRTNVNNTNVKRNINTSNPNLDSYRGHTSTPTAANTARPTTTQSHQAAQQRSSAFGGYGNGRETKSESQRGQASRQSMHQSGGGGFGGGKSGGGGMKAPSQKPSGGSRGGGGGGGGRKRR